VLKSVTVAACAVAALVSCSRAASAQEAPAAQIARLQLFSSFWPNLHHYLYASAWAARNAGPRSQATPLPPGPLPALTPDEQTAWQAAVDYYNRELASKDLLFDAQMTAINLALADASGDTLPAERLDARLRTVLEAAAPVYRRHWWTKHDVANRMWIADVVGRALPVATAIIDRLTRLYGKPWFTDPVRVDVVLVGKRQGAYTLVRPRVHIVMASADTSYGGTNGIEMLFHESSHALIDNVSQAIAAAARRAGKDTRDLWHVVLFYIAGEVTRQVLAARSVDYQPYLYALGLFDSAWPAFRVPVERHVRPFVDGQASLDQMAADLVAALP
jgi:hypothetical protein